MSVDNLLWGAPRIPSSALRSLSRPSPSIWSGEPTRSGRAGARFCVTMRHTSRPWICSWSRPSALTCSTFWPLFGWLGVINVTGHPTAEWIAQQITEAFPWNEPPRYLIRDRDGVYGAAVTRGLRAMSIRDKPITRGSPWQNCFAERLIGSLRRECVDHVVALGEQHLRQVLKSYASYYNTARTHRSLAKDAPLTRPIQRIGRIMSHALIGGMHHQYARA